MPVLPCPETPAVAAAVVDGSLTRDPRLAAHLQICGHCLTRVFGEYRALHGCPSPDEAPRRSAPERAEE